MATAKQIEANRKNATRSTGPRTAVGKLNSSRNALRHGLSLPLIMNAATLADIEELALLLANEDPNNIAAARHAAAAHLDLQRVQKFRCNMLAKMDLTTATAKDLQHLLAIDRYETRARSTQRSFTKLFFN
jgi:hypothetical protein